MSQLTKPNLEGVELEASEHADGWKYWTVRNSATLTPAAIRLLMMQETHDCELVCLYDDETEGADKSAEEILEHCANGGLLGLYPIKQEAVIQPKEYCVTVTEWRRYYVHATSKAMAEDLALTAEKNGQKPTSIDGDIEAELWEA